LPSCPLCLSCAYGIAISTTEEKNDLNNTLVGGEKKTQNPSGKMALSTSQKRQIKDMGKLTPSTLVIKMIMSSPDEHGNDIINTCGRVSQSEERE
jgi:hypothetical protein